MILLLLLACRGADPGLVVLADPDDAAILADSVAFLDDARVRLVEADDPVGALGDAGRREVAVAVVRDLDCGECFRVDQEGDGRFVVHGGGALGVQYGLADALERHGWRFFHPWQTWRPAEIALVDAEGLGVTEAPEQRIRGLDPHTLHPIEGLFDLWVPSAEGLDGARRTIDWLVKNRGNHLQWPGLDDIASDPALRESWAAHTGEILEYAHARGVRVGVGVQLFGGANLQQAYDLLDSSGGTAEEQTADIDARLDTLLDGLPFDAINLSFGEFSGESPEVFLDALDRATARILERLPDAEVGAVVHVGDTDDTRVEYQGEDIIYYFLVKWADPRIVPYIHTVMYYNLFEDAGGAYHHEDFAEHRQYLLDRIAAGQPATYFPESAYWVAFDNCVPTYLPLYIRSRWTDLRGIRDAGVGELDAHVLFSSGWEWGYWQNDVATLRMGWSLPDDYRDLLREMFLPLGDPDVAEAVGDLTDAQHEALLVNRLAPWMAGRELVMDLGRNLDIVSQPDRESFEELVALPAEDRAAFRVRVVDGMTRLADDTAAVRARLEASPGDDRFLNELRDGAAVDEHRARFVAAILDAVLDHADGDAGGAAEALDRATAELAAGRVVVARRHADLHDPQPELLTGDPVDGPTIYDYGYLGKADSLCFWERERVQVEAIVLGADEPDPGCVF